MPFVKGALVTTPLPVPIRGWRGLLTKKTYKTLIL